MADAKISDLAASTTPLAGTELAVIVQGGVTKQVAVSDIGSSDNFATADLTLTGNRIHDTNSNNLILSTDGATLNEANIGLTTAVAGLSFGNTAIDVRSTGLTLFESAIERVSVKPTETIINEDGGSYDFRVEGDTDTNLLFVDASTDRIGVGTVLPLAKLDIHADGALSTDIALNVRNSADTADLMSVDGLGTVYLSGKEAFKTTVADTFLRLNNSGDFTNGVFTSGTFRAGALQVGSSGVNFKSTTTETVINENGGDYDFRVEGDTEPNLLFTDASTDRVGIGTNTPSVELDVVGDTKVSGVVQVGEYTVATLPTASTYQAGTIMVSDETGGYTMAFSDGTNWRRTQDRAIVS